MAWSFDGGYLAENASVTWAFWWGDGRHDYKGIQVVQARPERRGSVIVVAGTPRYTVSEPSLQIESDGGYTYFVNVTKSRGDWDQYTMTGQRVD